MTSIDANSISILLVEDHDMTRSILRLALNQASDIQVIGEAADGKLAVAKALELQPAIILMDIGLPLLDGIEATKTIKNSPLSKNTRIIMLTTHDQENDVLAALSAGADGYCLKETDDKQLVIAIRAVHEGKAYLDPAIARIVLKAALVSKNTNVEPLSNQETHVLQEISQQAGTCTSGICMVDAQFLKRLHRFEKAFIA